MRELSERDGNEGTQRNMDGEIFETSVPKELKMGRYEKNKQQNNYIIL